MTRLRVYLAGPEVFLPDARAFGALKAQLAAEAGFEGCFPLDNALDLTGLTKPAQAQRILDANEALMRSCQFAIANCTPFRGVSMDSGTAYEVGFMRALGRPVFCYTSSPLSYAARARALRTAPPLATDCDRPTYEIEDFDLPENLMIGAAHAPLGGSMHVGRDDHAEMDDLSGYRACLERARGHFNLV